MIVGISVDAGIVFVEEKMLYGGEVFAKAYLAYKSTREPITLLEVEQAAKEFGLSGIGWAMSETVKTIAIAKII